MAEPLGIAGQHLETAADAAGEHQRGDAPDQHGAEHGGDQRILLASPRLRERSAALGIEPRFFVNERVELIAKQCDLTRHGTAFEGGIRGHAAPFVQALRNGVRLRPVSVNHGTHLPDAGSLLRRVHHQLFEAVEAVGEIDPCCAAVDKHRIAHHHARANPRGLTQQRVDQRRRLIQDVLAIGHPQCGLCRLLLGIEDKTEQSQLDQAWHGNQQQTLGEKFHVRLVVCPVAARWRWWAARRRHAAQAAEPPQRNRAIIEVNWRYFNLPALKRWLT